MNFSDWLVEAKKQVNVDISIDKWLKSVDGLVLDLKKLEDLKLKFKDKLNKIKDEKPEDKENKENKEDKDKSKTNTAIKKVEIDFKQQVKNKLTPEVKNKLVKPEVKNKLTPEVKKPK